MSTEDPSASAPVIDPTVASIARVYDAFLNGKDNYDVDRQVANAVIDRIPQTLQFAQEHRAWLIRVARFLAKAGVDQFLDCGSGLPTQENTHQAVQRVNPDATVVYVDNDPVVSVHGRALLEENEHCHFVAADLTDPTTLMDEVRTRNVFDFAKPVALIQCSTIHHVTDEERPHEIMRTYIDALPSGSYVALTHWHDPADGGEGSGIARYIQNTFRESSMGSANFRSRDEIMALFDGLELVEPGLGLLRDWWPDGPHITEAEPVDEIVLAAVGRKP